ncbi:MAG TPA: single-stranded-DNA-specific exonuclease RecJ [Candidatus Enterenecus stercoripullorum]|nr:single-stranded-DNA-specific exonuclease RecJ [Candidatus Enterenecus stercoripullorum]
MKYEQWNLRRAVSTDALRRMEQAGLPPLCAAVLCARGLDTPEKAAEFLAETPVLLRDPFLLQDMDRAAERIGRALDQGEAIAVYGDYDVDGITATCLLLEFLRERGGRVVSHIPDRTEEGYGLNPGAIDTLFQHGTSLIVTVDCGITAVREVEYAKTLGMDVVITDHHQCKGELPQAAAVVNPRRPDCPYPFKELAGVGVALKLALALTPPAGREAVLRRYGELAAIGTVADVMRLSDENRTLVRRGLSLMAETRRPGLRALLREAGWEAGTPPTAVTIGYGLAPRINAAGRMERAGVALELLLTKDEERGQDLALELCELNRKRQAIELAIYEQCDSLLARQPQLAEPVIVLAGESWHQGVVGIVASRLAEKYACPAFMISLDHGKGKGSCRSFGQFNLFAALERCAPLLEQYGGHALAAGFTIREENIPAFRAAMARLVSSYTQGYPMITALDVDAEIDSCTWLSCQQVDALSMLEPFGAGNPKPVFLLRSVCVQSCADVGNGRHLKMKVRRDGVTLDAIFFSANTAACGVAPGDRLDLAFHLQVNEYRNARAVQLQLCDLRPAPTRAKLEQALFRRLRQGELLSRWEASLLLPDRQDFAQLWRFLEQSCAAGPAVSRLDQLVRHAVRGQTHHGSYGKTLVCLHVMDERGLIQVTVSDDMISVCLQPQGDKVDLEQAQMMKRLRTILGPEPEEERRRRHGGEHSGTL